MNGPNGFLMIVGAGVVGALLGVGGASFRSNAITPVPVAVPAVQDVVMARRFSLRDDKGVERAVLAFGDNGEPGVSLFDRDGKTRAAMGLVGKGDPVVTLFDRDWKTRAAMIVTGNDDPGLLFYDTNGRLISTR